MALLQIEDPDDYLRLLEQSPPEVDALFQDLLIGVTSFFRDPEAFEVLSSTVIPRLVASKAPDSTLRVWVCGCSTGEEAYSIAMVIHEYIQGLEQTFKLQVFATDIDASAIQAARAGVYPESIAADVSLAAWFMAAAVIGGAIAQWPLGVLSDRIGRRNVLAMMCLTGTVLSAVVVFGASQWSFTAIALSGAAWGTIGFPLYSIAVAHSNDFAEPTEYVTVSAGLLLLYGIGAILGPLIASACINWFGAGGLFLFIAYVYGVLMIATLYRMLRGRRVAEDQHIAFADALAAAATASHVYEEEVQQQALESEDG